MAQCATARNRQRLRLAYAGHSGPCRSRGAQLTRFRRRVVILRNNAFGPKSHLVDHRPDRAGGGVIIEKSGFRSILPWPPAARVPPTDKGEAVGVSGGLAARTGLPCPASMRQIVLERHCVQRNPLAPAPSDRPAVSELRVVVGQSVVMRGDKMDMQSASGALCQLKDDDIRLVFIDTARHCTLRQAS